MKLARRIIATLTACTLVFGLMGLVGCSSESNSASTIVTTADINAGDIEVTGVGFRALEDGVVSYAFTVNNPNEGYIARDVTFTIEGYDADGEMLLGGGETLLEIYPGVTTGGAGIAYLSSSESQITSLEVVPLMDDVTWVKTSLTAEDINNMFSISDTTTEVTETGLQITGILSTNLDDPAFTETGIASPVNTGKNARIVALLLDAEGNIICGAESPSIILDTSMASDFFESTPDENVSFTDDDASKDVDEKDAKSSLVSNAFAILFPDDIEYATYELLVTPDL